MASSIHLPIQGKMCMPVAGELSSVDDRVAPAHFPWDTCAFCLVRDQGGVRLMQAGEGHRVCGQLPKLPERSPTTGCLDVMARSHSFRSASNRSTGKGNDDQMHLEEAYHQFLHTRATNRV